MRVAFAVLCACLALGLCTACAEDNSLGGSVSELFSLEISQVQILRNDQAFQVSYYQNDAEAVNIVARLSVSLTGASLTDGKALSLAGTYDDDHQRATVIHLAAGEPVRTFPNVKKGDLTLQQGGKEGEFTSGSFSLSFYQSDDYGGGRTVYGNFAGTAVDAGYGPDGNQPL